MLKVIYMLWFQGFKNAPYIVKKCLHSWIIHNPTWKIIKLDQNNLKNYINFDDRIKYINKKQIHKAALSDIARIVLLEKYGGLWVDATTFCNKPLDKWIENYIQEGFFAFNKPGPDRLLSSFFLYSDKNNYIVKEWFEKTMQYCNNIQHIGHKEPVVSIDKWNNKIYENHYFWFHYLFGDLYKSNDRFKGLWDKVPKLSADGLHYLQNKGLLNKLSYEVKDNINKKNIPLYKLTFKYDDKNYNDKCILAYLFKTIS
ncbi:capsular polysaccharide synthesis protein [Thermodesulfobacteriota bacterium]